MNYLLDKPANEMSFKDFLFNNQRNRIILYLAAVAIVIQFVIFKYLYPFASYIHGDSFAYLKAAEKNLTINTYMIGYSKFLRVFSTFAKPDYMLVAFQYMFIQCSVLFLLLTVYYFYKPGRYMQIILLCLMVFNPLFLHLGNMVSSDGLFLALSCTWFALLLWLIHRPSNKIIIWHAVILFTVFTVRYNALIYPLIASIAFGLSSLSLKKKIAGLSLVLLSCGCFVGFTMWRYKVLTGYWQYSPFSGWQLANNAMYAYREVGKSDREPVPDKFQTLDKMITKFNDQNRNLLIGEASTFYMWTPTLPLMLYRDSLFKKANDTAAIEFKKWATMGPLYKDYGLYIIKNYPFHFLRYFIWPNAKKYYAPPVEFLDEYNSGKRDVTKQAANWFGYKNTKVNVRMQNPKVKVLNYYPFLSGIINLFMLFGLMYYILLKGWQYNQIFNRTILIASSVWLLNAGFTIFASSAALRFQSFPIILTTIFTLLLIDWMIQLMQQLKEEQNKKKVLNNIIPPEAMA
jgi:hypothetical protein